MSKNRKRYQIVVIEGQKPRRLAEMNFGTDTYATAMARILQNRHPGSEYAVYDTEEGVQHGV